MQWNQFIKPGFQAIQPFTGVRAKPAAKPFQMDKLRGFSVFLQRGCLKSELLWEWSSYGSSQYDFSVVILLEKLHPSRTPESMQQIRVS